MEKLTLIALSVLTISTQILATEAPTPFVKLNAFVMRTQDSLELLSSNKEQRNWEEKGASNGFGASFETISKNEEHLYFRGAGSLKFGSRNFNSQVTQENYTTEASGNSGIVAFDYELLLGKAFRANEKIQVAPYLGYGSYIFDHDTPSQTYKSRDLSHSNELYSWHYLKAGVKAFYQLNKRLSLNPEFQLARTLFSKAETKDTFFTNKELVEVKLKNKFHTNLSFEADYKIDEKMNFMVTPFYENRPVGASNKMTSHGFSYPEIENYSFGLKVGMGVRF